VENSNSKVITISFMVTAALVGIVISALMGPLSATASGPLAHALSTDLVRHGLPVLVGLILFLSLQFNAGVVAWSDDVVTELARIVWPSRKDTTNMTVVVCIMLLISGVLLGVLDFVSGTAVDWLLHLNFKQIF
jgi:preprotein translocase subunit SecE